MQFMLSKQMTAIHQQYSPVFTSTEIKVNMKVGGHITKLIVV